MLVVCHPDLEVLTYDLYKDDIREGAIELTTNYACEGYFLFVFDEDRINLIKNGGIEL